jgi:hypothetical protein
MNLISLEKELFEQNPNQPDNKELNANKNLSPNNSNLKDDLQSALEEKESIETPLELLGFEVLKKLYWKGSPIKADKIISNEYIDGYGINIKRDSGVSVDFNFYYTINQVRINPKEELKDLKQRNRVPQGLLSTSMNDGKGFRRDKIYDVTTKTLLINEYQNGDFSIKTHSEQTQNEEEITKWLNQFKGNIASKIG